MMTALAPETPSMLWYQFIAAQRRSQSPPRFGFDFGRTARGLSHIDSFNLLPCCIIPTPIFTPISKVKESYVSVFFFLS